MRTMKLFGIVLALALGIGGCGGESCPGIICSNCAISGDCDIQCPAGEVETCGHFGYFDDPDLRCAYCSPQ